MSYKSIFANELSKVIHNLDKGVEEYSGTRLITLYQARSMFDIILNGATEDASEWNIMYFYHWWSMTLMKDCIPVELDKLLDDPSILTKLKEHGIYLTSSLLKYVAVGGKFKTLGLTSEESSKVLICAMSCGASDFIPSVEYYSPHSKLTMSSMKKDIKEKLYCLGETYTSLDKLSTDCEDDTSMKNLYSDVDLAILKQHLALVRGSIKNDKSDSVLSRLVQPQHYDSAEKYAWNMFMPPSMALSVYAVRYLKMTLIKCSELLGISTSTVSRNLNKFDILVSDHLLK